MSEINSKFLNELFLRRLIFFAFVIFPGFVFPACKLPTPDMGGEKVSPPNYTGYLEKAQSGGIFVRNYNNKKTQYIDVSDLAEAYSAYGGDEKFQNLKSGIAIRIWFKKCLPSRNPSADYVEFFSNNALDQPPRSYFLRH